MSRPAAAVDGYAALTPDAVLDALAGAGLHPDGRLLQLNSYENRVFQVFLDDGTAVVAKFYRPHRWSDAQILEEHAFALELAAHDVPVVAPLELRTTPSSAGGCMLAGTPATLAADVASGFRFSVSPRHAGRSPNSTTPPSPPGWAASSDACTRSARGSASRTGAAWTSFSGETRRGSGWSTTTS